MMRPPTVLLAGGGTGGHLYPGLAVAEALVARVEGARVLLADTRRDRAAEHGETIGLERVPLDSPRRPSSALGLPAFGARMTGAVARSVAALRRTRTDVVVGLGGYGSVAPVIAARALGLPVVLLEQNAVPGLATRALSRIASVVAASLPGLSEHGVRGRIVETGNPVRAAILRPWPAHDRLGLRPELPVLGVLGGSLGSRGVNQAVLQGLAGLVARVRSDGGRGFQLLHATGDEGQAEELRDECRRLGLAHCIRPFFHDMAAVYGTTDVFLCRAGGTTVAELTAVGATAVFVPYPHHADDHQHGNARSMVVRGAATLVDESELNPERLADELGPPLTDHVLRARRRREAARLGRAGAADRVVDLILDLCRMEPTSDAPRTPYLVRT